MTRANRTSAPRSMDAAPGRVPRSRITLFPILLPLALFAGNGVATAAAPAVERWDSAADAPVYYVHAPGIPMVDVHLTFDAGSTRDGDNPGLAELVSRTVDDATVQRSPGELARRLEDSGARVEASASRESASVSLRSLTEPEALDTALQTFEEILETPAFREASVERELERMRQALQAERQSASAIAERELYRAMYGDHPYGSPPSGTREALERLGRDDVVAFHERHYVAENVGVAIVGDVERERAEAIARRVVEALPRGEAPEPLPEVPAEPATEEVRIDFPAAQTAVYFGAPVVARGDDAEFPFRVVDQAMGGAGLTSRLHQAMREERGLSYATSSRLRLGSIRSPWVVQSTVHAERAEEAVEVLYGEIERLARDGLDDDEIERTIRHLTGSFPLALASNASLVRQLSVLARHRLPEDHLDQYIPRVEAVDAEAIRRSLDERLDPERMVRVLVGPDVEREGE